MTTGLKKALIAITALAMPSSAWAACTVTSPSPTALGTYSPPALVNGAPPYVDVPGGFDCPSTVISLLGGNYLRATVTSPDGFKLTSTNPANTVTAKYVVAADAAGAYPFTPGTPFVYMNGGVINLLGLLGGTARNVQVHVRPSSTAAVAPGTYTGSFKIAWEWRFCDVLGLLGACVGTLDQNPATIPVANVSVTMIVAAKPIGVTIITRTTWDPLSATNNPRAIPGSKQRTTITLTNSDIVAVDANSLAIVLPTPSRGAVALDGDGSASTAFVTTAEGSPASSLAVTYTAPASTTDDVDFSANGGTSWTYDPTSAPKSVTTVRIRPRGTMAAGSSFSVSLPYVLF
ncbi:protein CsuE [Sphingomonas sp. CFBP 13603]|uniref:protein CsuE n=1 Tax=Sphingomonas sp. CFBP 13603 TaxID=2774040 RepID=UPI001867B31E|nr:protein CsuE [Sphingomonas sp. CFBP 13603]MBE2991756.1 protein CsuE [Sphingomonas sp. CFBP 13603]